MKILLGLIASTLLAFPVTTKAQNKRVIDILNRVDQAVLKLEQGQFIFHDKFSKVVTDDDSVRTEHTSVCFFKKTPNDSLMGYQLASFRKDGYQQVYDGEQLFTVYSRALEVTSKQEYSSKIKEEFDGFTGPTFLKNTNLRLQYFKRPSSIQTLQYSGLDYFQGEKCYKLISKYSQNLKKTSKVCYYISINSFLPIRTVTSLESVVGNTKETLIFDYSVTNLRKDVLEGNQFSRDKLTGYSFERNYNASDEIKDELLPVGSIAPNWKLPLISGDSMELAELKGKVVIMDFWFKACAPCQKQMIALQTLHEKFSTEKVIIIGINTIDDLKRDQLELFLKNRMITMPSVYRGNSIKSLYKVYGSPALFVIDKKGVIIYNMSGYSSNLIEKVEQVIAKQVDN